MVRLLLVGERVYHSPKQIPWHVLAWYAHQLISRGISLDDSTRQFHRN
jgi:hypothetical protein